MALTKITGFSGEAELRGALRPVQFQGQALTIFGLALEDAYELLDALSAKQITAVRVQSPEGSSSPILTRPSDPDSPFIAPSPSATPPPSATPSPSLVEAAEIGLPTNGTNGTNGTNASGVAIPESVLSSRRFIEVLDWAMKSQGYARTDVSKIVAFLESIKGQIPVLSRARSISEKVESNLIAYQESGDV